MAMGTTANRDQFAALVGVLRQERAALDWLAFKVAEAELLTAAHEARFLAMIVDEVDDIADEVGTIEVARAMIVAELCDVLGERDDDISLTELIAHAPPEIAEILTELRDELLELTDRLASAAMRGMAAAKTQKTALAAALSNLEPAAPGGTGYDQWGGRATTTPAATRFNEAL